MNDYANLRILVTTGTSPIIDTVEPKQKELKTANNEPNLANPPIDRDEIKWMESRTDVGESKLGELKTVFFFQNTVIRYVIDCEPKW